MSLLELPRYTDRDPSLNRVPGQEKVGQNGTLIMIGGRAEEASLRVVADHLPDSKHLTVTTIASDEPEYQYVKYEQGFKLLGVDTTHLGLSDIEGDADSYLDPETSGLFVTGGGQDRLMRRLMASFFNRELRQFHEDGKMVIGTSAGASFMGEIMPLRDTHAPGFGFVPHIIDQHIKRSGRNGRLAGLIEQFPDRIGIGIDENTAVIYQNEHMHIMGEGQVYVIAKSGSSSVDEIILREGDMFDLSTLNSSVDIAAGD